MNAFFINTDNWSFSSSINPNIIILRILRNRSIDIQISIILLFNPSVRKASTSGLTQINFTSIINSLISLTITRIFCNTNINRATCIQLYRPIIPETNRIVSLSYKRIKINRIGIRRVQFSPSIIDHRILVSFLKQYIYFRATISKSITHEILTPFISLSNTSL